MFQVVLAGGIFPLHGKIGLEQLAWFSPSRWGYAAMAATTNLNKVLPPVAPGGGLASTDPLWSHTSATWLTDIGVLLVLALVFFLLTWRRLSTMRPLRRR
jgi:hypothetical protein